MAKYGVLLTLLFVGGLVALPASRDDGPGFNEEMAIFFDQAIPDIEGRIVGGTVAAEGAFPWMVALTNGAIQFFFCGGSIITNRHILSAAHCIVSVVSGGSLSSTLRVTAGTNRWNSGGQTHNVQGFRNHPQYNEITIKNDIGILITRTNIVMNNRVTRIPLNTGFVGGNVACRVSGWGRTVSGRGMSPVLLELRTTTVNGQRCITQVASISQQLNIRVPHVDPAIEICTFVAVNRGVCRGDSGSALVLNSNNAQIGVVSWGLPCARGAPDMFVRVSAYINWIRGITG